MSTKANKKKPAAKPNSRALARLESDVLSKVVKSPVRASLVARERQIDNRINSDILKSNVPAMRGQQSGGSRRVAGPVRPPTGQGKRRRTLDPKLKAWLDLVAYPFESPPAKCPVNYNVAPSVNTSLARVDYINVGLVIATGSTTEIGLMGHGAYTGEIDQTSSHCALQRSGLVSPAQADFVVGPMAVSTPTAYLNMMGYILGGLSLGTSTITTNVNGCNAIQPANPLPYSASIGDGAHTRWKLVSMGIELENVTAANQVAGDVITVQPSTDFLSPDTQFINAYMRFPSFQISVDANDGTLSRSWIPLTRDLCYSHSVPAATAAPVSSTAAVPFKIWINNPSLNLQYYTVRIVQHYELTGANLTTVSTPAIMKPALTNIVEPAIEATRYLSHSAKAFPDIAAHVAANESPFVEDHSNSFLGDVMKHLGDRATSVAKDFLLSFI